MYSLSFSVVSFPKLIKILRNSFKIMVVLDLAATLVVCEESFILLFTALILIPLALATSITSEKIMQVICAQMFYIS